MSKSLIVIEAKDCFPFENQKGHGEAIQHFISNQKRLNIFNINAERTDENLEIAYFNNRDAKWYAGRLVGDAEFEFKGSAYRIVIRPRFGNLQLFRMLEEVFNIKLSASKGAITRTDDYQYLIKHLIPFLWINILSKANKHGIPKHNVVKKYKGAVVRGRLDVKRSIIPLFTEEKIVSSYNEKVIDSNVAKILFKAYQILKSEYNLSSIKTSVAAKNAIEQIFSSNTRNTYISEQEYKNIQYREIYKTFKPIVDLSWDIIKNKEFGNNKDDNSDSLSFFIDMAEVWEVYLRSILKKHFSKYGWRLRIDKIQSYRNKDFRRSMIPDIVLEKGEDIMVWDAKYKRMKFDYFDYDRVDFFQIHTYINYYNQSKNVIAGGLLYPISKEFNKEVQERNKASSLFSQNQSKTKFIVDGIDYTEISEDKIRIEEDKFLKRIANL